MAVAFWADALTAPQPILMRRRLTTLATVFLQDVPFLMH